MRLDGAVVSRNGQSANWNNEKVRANLMNLTKSSNDYVVPRMNINWMRRGRQRDE